MLSNSDDFNVEENIDIKSDLEESDIVKNEDNKEAEAEAEIEIIIPFEEDYEDIKNDTNLIWYKYQDKIKKITNGIAYWKNFDKDELIQQSFIYFTEFSKIYDPYYNGNFIPFDKFLFKNLIIKLRSYVQRYYFKTKREQPTEFSEYATQSTAKNNIIEVEDKIYSEYIYSLISKRQQQILDLSLQGYKQQEIGEMLKISQSRVSVIKKKTLNKLNEVLENKKNGKKSIKKI
jgi:RNA polymerase sigma factor (sigma-70 family)